MQTITLLCIGSLKQSMYKAAVQFFTQRLSHQCKFSLIELPDSKQTDVQKKRSEETQKLIEYTKKHPGMYIAFDETGTLVSSTQLAKKIESYKQRSNELTFIIGGAYGFTKELVQACTECISLSPCTFTHELCRVIALEQLYRSLQIEQNTGYHHL